MSTQLILLLGLIFIETSLASPGLLDNIPGKSLLSGLTETAMGTVNKYLLDKVDGKGVSDRYNVIFKDIKKDISHWSCVSGLYADVPRTPKTLRLDQGNMTELENLSMNTEVLQEDEDYVTASVKFTLPTLPLTYNFHYTTWRIIPITRDGKVLLSQNGLTLEFTVEMPKTQSRIDNLIEMKKCVAKVKSFQTDIAAKLLLCDDVVYANTFGLGVTGRSVRDIVNAMLRNIQENVVKAFQLLIEPKFRGFSFNCKDAEYIIPTGAAAQKPLDCNHVERVKNVRI